MRNADSAIEYKFSKNSISTMTHNAKMRVTCLKLCNTKVPEKLLEKRTTMLNHKKSM